jgi:hypothetical protein
MMRATGRRRPGSAASVPAGVVIWMASAGRYRAYPLFRAPRGTAVTAATPDELTDEMDQVQQAACRPLAGYAQRHHDPC